MRAVHCAQRARQPWAAALCLLALFFTGAPVAADALKVLHVARTAQFESLDPPRQFDIFSHDLVSMVYSSLLKYAYLDRPFKLEPDLLERMPELGADRLTLTFKLKKGIRFRDDKAFPGGKGRELTADDVLFSLRRFADANVNHKSWFLMEGAVVGLDAYRAATAKAGPKGDSSKLTVEGFKKVDSHTFTIRLTKPNPLFLFALATSATAIVPPEAVATYGDQLAVNPVGTGPFTLDKVDRKGVLRFVKNPNYHGTYPTVGEPGDAEKGLLKDAGRKLPLVDVVEMPLIEEAQPAMLKFLKGELDWRGLDRANFTKMIVRAGDGDWKLNGEFAAKFNIYWVPGTDTNYTGLNLRDPLLGGYKKLRQALAHLVDTQAYIDVLANGRGVRLKSIVPLPLPGNERETGATYYAYDVAQAKKLLAEAGFPDGKGLPPLTVIYSGTTADTRMRADLTKVKFAAAGVQIKPVFTDAPTFQRNQESGAFQLTETAWNADYPDPENFYQLLYSKNGPPGPNLSAFNNAAYDKAYEAARHMPNGPERIALLRTMNEIIKEEVPVIIGQNSLRFGITQKWLTNFKRNLLAPEYMYLDVNMALKSKGAQ
jgi:oligopeptide transport system substrate-binding protein